ncbi:hypothetical protein MG293_020723 [Ovis ammon polii]|uniref:Uncharacterized protein n=1 Tax=Ovis ammon polii TaxID=230172 RepID=A0AAD4TPY7_OVIAM|nr:hypothetical protein MG293_020723 [Ovis ammon polii]KAI4550336.1 hypothetical protein MJT46_019062 [Ovis ammon polii x Ovis aries]
MQSLEPLQVPGHKLMQQHCAKRVINGHSCLVNQVKRIAGLDCSLEDADKIPQNLEKEDYMLIEGEPVAPNTRQFSQQVAHTRPEWQRVGCKVLVIGFRFTEIDLWEGAVTTLLTELEDSTFNHSPSDQQTAGPPGVTDTEASGTPGPRNRFHKMHRRQARGGAGYFLFHELSAGSVSIHSSLLDVQNFWKSKKEMHLTLQDLDLIATHSSSESCF